MAVLSIDDEQHAHAAVHFPVMRGVTDKAWVSLTGQGFPCLGGFMTTTKLFLVPAVLVLAGLTIACGSNADTAEAAAPSEAASAAALDAGAEGPATQDTESASSAVTVETAAASVPAPAAATVAVLPLKRGYYVRSETPCNQASRADVFSLVTRTGTNLNCTFKKIEQTGATTYRVTEECSDGGAAWGRENGTETSTSIYEIPNETSYKVTYEGGYEASARYCAQSSMSPGYRDNDISDVIR